MPAKALLAQQLLSFAWARHLDDGQYHRAWPWADSMPIAQLILGENAQPFVVLSGVSGENLALSPSWMQSTSAFNQGGNSVIFAHNDTHFNPLKNAQLGNEISVVLRGKEEFHYKISKLKIVDKNDLTVLENDGIEKITLITCYPFDSTVRHTRLRYIVIAERV
ncbi:MAG TPA: class GN sortase [Psychromonas hadalis]|nr:class GN sortase [Psychromonas hadalis]